MLLPTIWSMSMQLVAAVNVAVQANDTAGTAHELHTGVSRYLCNSNHAHEHQGCLLVQSAETARQHKCNKHVPGYVMQDIAGLLAKCQQSIHGKRCTLPIPLARYRLLGSGKQTGLCLASHSLAYVLEDSPINSDCTHQLGAGKNICCRHM